MSHVHGLGAQCTQYIIPCRLKKQIWWLTCLLTVRPHTPSTPLHLYICMISVHPTPSTCRRSLESVLVWTGTFRIYFSFLARHIPSFVLCRSTGSMHCKKFFPWIWKGLAAKCEVLLHSTGIWLTASCWDSYMTTYLRIFSYIFKNSRMFCKCVNGLQINRPPFLIIFVMIPKYFFRITLFWLLNRAYTFLLFE